MKSQFTCAINYLIAFSFLQLLNISTIAQLTPVVINGLSLNRDLIAEGAGNNPTTITSASIGGNRVLYDESFKINHPIITAGGVPATGIIINSGDIWHLRPFTANNALLFPPQSASVSSSIYLATPAKFSKLSLLTTCAVGSVIVNIHLTFSDDSFTDYGSFTVNNWIGQTPFVIQGFGSILRSTPIVAQEGTPDDPRLYQLDINVNAADQLKDVTSIDITNTDESNSSTVAFFAVSGIAMQALPITISSLSAQYQASDKKIVLNWEAEPGLNSIGFEVQRSPDATVFSSIATVNSKKTAGASNYSYIDYDLQSRQSWFYRIKETMAGGQINYSKIINVKTSAAASFTMIQSGGYIHLATTLADKSYTYKIVDLHGRELKSGTVSAASQFTIDIQSLPSGLYILNVLNHTEVRSLKFVK